MARNLLAWGQRWLSGQRHAHETSTVTFTRGASSVSIAATVGRSTFQRSDGEGGMVVVETTDYIVRAADLVLSAATVLPRRGDEIADANSVVWAAVDGEAGAAYSWCDPETRLDLRIHTERKTTTP